MFRRFFAGTLGLTLSKNNSETKEEVMEVGY